MLGSRKTKVKLSPICSPTFRTFEVDKWEVLNFEVNYDS